MPSEQEGFPVRLDGGLHLGSQLVEVVGQGHRGATPNLRLVLFCFFF